jgi:uncharacterized alpha-E superfamily protein
MISRVADHCFWFGRYLERAESAARVLHVTNNLALDAELPPQQCWLPVVIVSGEREQFLAKHGEEAASDGEIVQEYLTWADDNLTSLIRSVSAARENARSIREVVSLEAFQTINELYLWIHGPEARATYARNRYEFYRHIRQASQLVLGLLRSTMLHDTPLDFIWLGTMLERVGQTARVLDVHHHAFTTLPARHQIIETALWLSLLRACSGFEPFMKRSQGRVTGDAVAAFLILEPAFPRSIRYCVHAAFDRLSSIRPPGAQKLPGAEGLARLGELDGYLRQTSSEALSGTIHDLLTHVVNETAAVCNDIARELFGLATAPSPSQTPARASSPPLAPLPPLPPLSSVAPAQSSAQSPSAAQAQSSRSSA